jgi:hypothetical protein
MDGSSWLKGVIMFRAGRQPAQSNRFLPADKVIGSRKTKKGQGLARDPLRAEPLEPYV